jgi:hypothetical protein
VTAVLFERSGRKAVPGDAIVDGTGQVNFSIICNLVWSFPLPLVAACLASCLQIDFSYALIGDSAVALR